MKFNGVVQRKLELIAANTRRLRTLLPLKSERFADDFFLKNGIERTLQISIEAMIDIANRITSLNGQPPPADSYQALVQLAELKVIMDAKAYRDMVRFRNFMVHRYEYIEPESIVSIVNRHLADFDKFVAEIAEYGQSGQG